MYRVRAGDVPKALRAARYPAVFEVGWTFRERHQAVAGDNHAGAGHIGTNHHTAESPAGGCQGGLDIGFSARSGVSRRGHFMANIPGDTAPRDFPSDCGDFGGRMASPRTFRNAGSVQFEPIVSGNARFDVADAGEAEALVASLFGALETVYPSQTPVQAGQPQTSKPPSPAERAHMFEHDKGREAPQSPLEYKRPAREGSPRLWFAQLPSPSMLAMPHGSPRATNSDCTSLGKIQACNAQDRQTPAVPMSASPGSRQNDVPAAVHASKDVTNGTAWPLFGKPPTYSSPVPPLPVSSSSGPERSHSLGTTRSRGRLRAASPSSTGSRLWSRSPTPPPLATPRSSGSLGSYSHRNTSHGSGTVRARFAPPTPTPVQESLRHKYGFASSSSPSVRAASATPSSRISGSGDQRGIEPDTLGFKGLHNVVNGESSPWARAAATDPTSCPLETATGVDGGPKQTHDVSAVAFTRPTHAGNDFMANWTQSSGLARIQAFRQEVLDAPAIASGCLVGPHVQRRSSSPGSAMEGFTHRRNALPAAAQLQHRRNLMS